MTKVFCIGFNKTGTTSLHRMFQQAGLRSYHNTDWWRWPADDERWRQYDAYCDGWPSESAVRGLLRRFPSAKFILNTRRLDDWLLSRYQHVERNKRSGKSEWLDNSDAAIARWIAARRHHHGKVRQMFGANRRLEKQLMIVDFCGIADEHQKVFAFVGIPLLKRHRLSKPHANRRRTVARRTVDERRLLHRWAQQNNLSDNDLASLDV